MNQQQAAQAVLNRINETQDGLIAFLGEYLRFASVNPEMSHDGSKTDMTRCQLWLRDRLAEWSAFDEVRTLAKDSEQPNVVGRRRGTGSGPSLLFNGHSDVVPVTNEQAAAWTGPGPWSGQLADGKIWGRGASDMKGGNAAFLWAIKSLAEVGVSLRGDLIATLVVGEETGNHTIGVDLLAENGVTAPFAVLAEPTDLSLCPASVGEFYFLLHVDGLSTSLANRHLSIHPAAYGEPVHGVNAIDKMWKIQAALYNLEREWGVWQRHPLMASGNMNINFSRLHAGDTYSAMAESCELTGSVLFNPSLRFTDVLDEFRRAIDQVAATDYWLRDHPPILTVPYVLEQKEPINVPAGHPGCQALIRACQQVTGKEPHIGCSTATSDGNYLYARGQNIVTFGPGLESAGVHGSNEYIGVDNLIKACKVYAVMAIEWCGLA